MIERLDFSMPPAVLSAVVAVAALPLSLLATSRVPGLSGRTARQFLTGFVLTLGLWIALVIRSTGWQAPAVGDLVVGLMVLAAGSMVLLEVWGLLSRGYTLALLLTLYRAGRPLDDEELARSYRGGQGLAWVMKHRLTGLIAVGLAHEHDGKVALTPLKGVWVARLYRLGLAILGLRLRTGG